MALTLTVEVDIEPQNKNTSIETYGLFKTSDSGCSSSNSLSTKLPLKSEDEFSSTLSLPSLKERKNGGLTDEICMDDSKISTSTNSAKLKLLRGNSYSYTYSAGLQKNTPNLRRSLSLPLLDPTGCLYLLTNTVSPTLAGSELKSNHEDKSSLQGSCVLCGEVVSGAHEKLACCKSWICELCQVIYSMDYTENSNDSLRCPNSACDFLTAPAVPSQVTPNPPQTPALLPRAESASNESRIIQVHECIVCYGEMMFQSMQCERPCCSERVCTSCLVEIIRTNVLSEGKVHIACPNPDCEGLITRKEILALSDKSTREKYECLCANQSITKNRKTCPNCNEVTEHKLPRKLWKHHERDIHLTCKKCSHEWCFSCHAPWHKELTCREFLKGDKRFKKWTKSAWRGTPNCQKCPLCRVYIQKSKGCNHMTCNRCTAEFCYKCGGFYNFEVPLFGGHHSRTSAFGCKHNYEVNNPFKRRAVRGGYFGAKLAMLTGYPVLFVAGAAVLIVGGAVGLPIYGAYKYNKYRKAKRRLQRRSSRQYV